MGFSNIERDVVAAVLSLVYLMQDVMLNKNRSSRREIVKRD